MTWSVPHLLGYFAPVFIGAFRRWRDPSSSWLAWGLFLIVLLTGWTVIGWRWALRMAFRDPPLPEWLKKAPAGDGGGGSPGEQPDLSFDLSEQPAPSSCDARGGSGTQICSPCSGQGQWYQEGQPRSRDYCGARDQQTCSSCGGTGKGR